MAYIVSSFTDGVQRFDTFLEAYKFMELDDNYWRLSFIDRYGRHKWSRCDKDFLELLKYNDYFVPSYQSDSEIYWIDKPLQFVRYRLIQPIPIKTVLTDKQFFDMYKTLDRSI